MKTVNNGDLQFQQTSSPSTTRQIISKESVPSPSDSNHDEDETSLLITEMGHTKKNSLKQQKTCDTRSQSLPNCCQHQFEVKSNNCEENCDKIDKTADLQSDQQWFKTWPERYDKIRASPNDDDDDDDDNNTQNHKTDCDNIRLNGNSKQYSFNEAVQNISLAYSPITKQLHLVENHKIDIDGENYEKRGHKRTETASSTISSLSEPSTSGSLLDPDEKSLNNFVDNNEETTKTRTFSKFFNKNYFTWKLFSNHNNNNDDKTTKESPHHIASSTALIQHPRPSNLPAKTQEEEERHRQEYKRIIAAAKKKEQQTNAARQRLQKLQLEQEEQQANSAKHFTKYVLTNWENMRNTRKTRELWWQGLPSSVRGKVWRLAIGNELNLTPQLYEICLNRIQIRLNSPELYERHDQENSIDAIQLDISRTFPHLCIFQEGGPYSDLLYQLLAAYVCYRPDVGYVQGMSYIAAILILNMDVYDAFISFANLLNQPLHLSAFTLNQQQMNAYYNAYNELFNYNLPKLFVHFDQSKLTPDLYLLDWIYTIFAKAMPLDIACRVWDIFLRDGYEFIFRTALGILHLNQDVLIDMDFLHGAQFLTHLPDDLSSDQLFKSIQSITTNIGKQSFHQIVDKYNNNNSNCSSCSRNSSSNSSGSSSR